MNRDDLTTARAAKLHAAVQPMLGYLFRLEQRIRQTGFGRQDKLYALVAEAHEAMHRLAVETHYMSCASGVGRPPRK